MAHLRPATRLPPHRADQVEGRMLQVDRDGLLVERDGWLGQLRGGWAEAGVRFGRLA